MVPLLPFIVIEVFQLKKSFHANARAAVRFTFSSLRPCDFILLFFLHSLTLARSLSLSLYLSLSIAPTVEQHTRPRDHENIITNLRAGVDQSGGLWPPKDLDSSFSFSIYISPDIVAKRPHSPGGRGMTMSCHIQ